MSVECCANGCSSRSDLNPEIAFYQFPEEKERCHDWLESIVREDLKQLSVEQICSDFYVCALHFDDSYLQGATEGVEGSCNGEDEESKKDLKEYLTEEPAKETESLLLEDGKTQLVYVEGIGHIRLKTETDDSSIILHNNSTLQNINSLQNSPSLANTNSSLAVNNTTSNDISTEATSTSNVRLVNSGKDYMLCMVDEGGEADGQYLVKQGDELLKVFDPTNDNNDFQLLNNGVAKVKFERKDELFAKDGDDNDLNHLDNSDKVFSYLCHTCGQNFEDFNQLSTHMMEEHTGSTGGLAVTTPPSTTLQAAPTTINPATQSFQCNECKQEFTMFDQLRTHVRNHVQSRNFACDVCSAAFSHRSNLSRHKQQHCSAKKFQCDQCGKGFTQKSNLVTHQQTVHSAFMQLQSMSSLCRPGAERVHRKPKIHACSICGKAFVSLMGLKNHGALHTGDRPFVCAMCNKSFTLMSCLKTHMATIHTGKKHFCELCGKSYQSEHYLKIHLRIHSGIKDFECESCSKRFIDLPSLKLHTRTHTGEKPFNCRVCSRSFTQQSHLKTHMRVHTGEKPYECKDCGKYFRQLSNVLEHSRTHRKPINEL